MKNICLPPRLATAASFIRPGARIADIGTDHGLVPAYLALRGDASYIIASDVKEGPLSAARRTAEEHGVLDKIDFRLTNGLSGMERDGLDTVLLAGMGGETIASILTADSWVMRDGARLVIQPQSKLPLLFDTLTAHGMSVADASLSRDSGRIYLVFAAEMSDTATSMTDAEKYVPKMLIEKQDPLLPEYLQILESRITSAIKGMERAAGSLDTNTEKRTLEGIINIKKETEKWRR